MRHHRATITNFGYIKTISLPKPTNKVKKETETATETEIERMKVKIKILPNKFY